MKHQLGLVYCSPAAQRAIEDAGQDPTFFLDRHFVGDWGAVNDEDKRANATALVEGGWLVSGYRTLKNVPLVLLTKIENEGGTAATTVIVLWDEYVAETRP